MTITHKLSTYNVTSSYINPFLFDILKREKEQSLNLADG